MEDVVDIVDVEDVVDVECMMYYCDDAGVCLMQGVRFIVIMERNTENVTEEESENSAKETKILLEHKFMRN